MKTNILVNNTNMKQYIKYLCAVVLMLGMSISAWGAVIDKTNYTISTDDIDFGNLDASTPAYVAAGVIETYQEVTITLKKNVNTYVYFVASPDDYYITGYSDASTFFVGSATGSYTIRVYTYFELDNGTHTHTLYFYMGAESEEISVTGTVINACTPNDVAYDHSGTGGNDPTGDATACEDATVSFTPDPSTGYEYSGATVYLSDMETVHASLNSSTTSFTMPNEDVYVVATYAPIDYTISFNANGGSSTMESVERAYNSTYELPACTFTAPAGKVFKCWAEGSAEGTERAVGYSHTVAGDITFYAKWRDGSYTDYVFSCAELTLTAKTVTDGAPIFITSAASKTVRSQDSILIVGNGLTPNTTLTYPGLPSKFAIKTRLGADLQTDVNGEINAVAYIFYTPDAGDETDGLDKLTGISVSVGGAKPITKTLTQSIIGRHLSADFVIAVKRNGKWYALPDTMTGTWNPKPVEIAVDDIDNPTIAYTATTNVYNLYGQVSETIGGQAGYLYSNGHTIKLGMKNNATYANYPLFGSAGISTIGKGGIATSVTNNIGKQYWWVLTQTNTSIENAQDAKYSIKSANNTAPLILKENAGNPQWGFFTTGSVGPIRLIPASASSVVPLEAKIVAWGKDSAIIEADVPTIIAHYVKGKLPGNIESEKITLSQTGTSVKGTGTRFNYTVGFGASMDFSANEGKMLTLEWYDVLDNLVAVSNVTVPKIVASDITISKANYTNKSVWNTEVHVMPGKTVTIDASAYDGSNVTIKELNIYPGATVTVTGGTLIPTTLVLRNGWSRIGEKKYEIARLHIASTGSVGSTTAYADWYIDYDQYYPIAVPWKVATEDISYQNMTVAIDQGLIIRRYDGERHAKGGKDGDGNTNWKQYSWDTDMPTHLVPGIGYAITARRPAGKAFSIIRMPLTIPSTAWTINGEQGEVSSVHKDQVAVTAWVKDEGETPDHAKGWNFIANPYMCIYEGPITHSVDDDYDIEYVNIPDVNFKEFDQVATDKAKLKPGSGFLIQTEETGTLTFGTSNRKASAPSYRTATPKATKQKAYIILSGEEAEDEMGLIISERYTAEYEINADLEKLLSDGNTLRTFMRYGELNMAYVAINEELAREWIPVTVRIPAAGEYTFSLHEASKISELEGIYLIDYESNTVTNLIEDNYSFVAAGGTIADRFAINAIVGKHNTPTDIDIINAGGDINSKKPVKFIWDDKVFILHNGVIYDSTGKRVREINK